MNSELDKMNPEQGNLKMVQAGKKKKKTFTASVSLLNTSR